MASRKNLPLVVDALIKKGADLNAKGPGAAHTGVAIAAYWGFFECMKILIEAGADVNFGGDLNGVFTAT